MKNPHQHWDFKADVSDYHFGLFSECMSDLADIAKRIDDFWRGGILSSFQLEKAARDMSVAIRKVMIDNGGELFKTCVMGPKLHRLKRPDENLGSEILVEKIDGMSIDFTIGSTDLSRTFRAPGYAHRTVVKPLYGLRRVGVQRYRFDDLFDVSRQPLKFGRWMNTEVLQVGDDKLKAQQVLNLIAVKEGAHVELNEMTKFSMSAPVDLKLADRNDELYRKCNLITFGRISYIHVFTLLVGIYLLNMTKASLQRTSNGRQNQLSPGYDMIMRSPLKLPDLDIALEKSFGIGLVFRNSGDPHNPFEIQGAFNKVGTTTVKIPDRDRR